jgi:hypothetical protein
LSQLSKYDEIESLAERLDAKIASR